MSYKCAQLGTIIVCMIYFNLNAAVSKILQKKSVTLEKHECRIIPLYTEVHDKIQGTLAVMVTGLNKDINCELLQMYFSNRRKSGGFGIQSIFMKSEEGKAVITFESVDGELIYEKHTGIAFPVDNNCTMYVDLAYVLLYTIIIRYLKTNY